MEESTEFTVEAENSRICDRIDLIIIRVFMTHPDSYREIGYVRSDFSDPQGKYNTKLRYGLVYWFKKDGSSGKTHFVIPVDPSAPKDDWPNNEDLPRLLGQDVVDDTSISGGDYENIEYILGELEKRLNLSSH